MNRCKRCGACQECGATPNPYQVWPYIQSPPYMWPNTNQPFINTPKTTWMSQSGGSQSAPRGSFQSLN